MKSMFISLFVSLLFVAGCSSKSDSNPSGDNNTPPPPGKPVEIEIPADMKESFRAEVVEFSKTTLYPKGAADVSQVLGRVVEEKDWTETQWPAFFLTERACVLGGISSFSPAMSTSDQGTGANKLSDAKTAYRYLIPYRFNYFLMQDDAANWIPEISRAAALVSKTAQDLGYGAAYYQLRANRLTVDMAKDAVWNPECGVRVEGVKHKYSSLVSLGLQFSLIVKLTSAQPGFAPNALDGSAYEILYGGLGAQKEMEKLLLSKKVHISLIWAQLGGDSAPFRKIIEQSQCQTYALHKCQETIAEIQKEISAQLMTDAETETFRWAPVLVKFDTI
ncbi:MAG: hypothetical protein ACXWC9_01005 [Pseudobdellovibrionaceae bacterium]